MSLPRRRFLEATLATSSLLLSPFSWGEKSRTRRRVVIIGGGFAGATAAKYLKLWSDDNIDVILIERNPAFISCPQSNLVLGGVRAMSDLTHEYNLLESKYKIQRVHAEVTHVDAEAQSVQLHDGVQIHYDRLIIAPGVDFIYDELPTIASHEAQQKVPHAWKAGPQTENLHKQISAMEQGGRVILTIPATPFRCPPGPYERACQIASFLKKSNPSAKVLILDANPDIASKKSLFTNAWNAQYASLIEYIPSSHIEQVNVKTLSVETEFESYRADVLNVIPPQKAGIVAEIAGVINVDDRWCEVDFLTYESTVIPNIHIIGDAVYSNLPKSGHMANAQAKVCAAAVVALLSDKEPVAEPIITNTCYSFVNDNEAGHVAAVYRYDVSSKSMLAMPGGGVSELATKLEGQYAMAWAENIWHDVLR
jgi:NADPH-dependent 2,4-dienoyl-CoA reductase/sulfur reductase-like enzyme